MTAVSVFDGGESAQRGQVSAGQIGKLWGLGTIQVGDAIGAPRTAGSQRHFAPPTLETVIASRRPEDRGALRVALEQLAEQDPLIKVQQDDARQETSVSLYGEVQKEVIQATLATDYGIEVTFHQTTTICVERPAGIGEAVQVIGEEANPFLATVGLRVEPAPPDSGIEFRLRVEARTVCRCTSTRAWSTSPA